ncbi:hypothetical protein [Streptomyces sp. NPDC057554]|uniref:hypothetical protein n=1 Tax=Streptomyces sp. NPDC057554 TaxID=3350538 RepID=UPI0036B33AC7
MAAADLGLGYGVRRGLVAFWFLGVGEPAEDGRLRSSGELRAQGGALAVIALYCALNVEGAVSSALPGRTRALRGTVRRGQVAVAAATGDPRGPRSVDLRIPGLSADEAATGMQGLDLWLCWDTRRAKRDFAQDGPPRQQAGPHRRRRLREFLRHSQGGTAPPHFNRDGQSDPG